jgi:hypothetical protein
MTMTDYRAYIVGHGWHFTQVEVVTAEDDGD